MARSRQRSRGRRGGWHWRPWASERILPWVRENWSKSGFSTTLGPRVAHRTIGPDYVTDTFDLTWWLPWRFRELGRFQRRRARGGRRRGQHHHGCLLLVTAALGIGLSRAPSWQAWATGYVLLGIALLGTWASLRRVDGVEEEPATER